MLKTLRVVSGGLVLVLGACGMEDADVTGTSSALEADRNQFGVAESFHTTGAIDFNNPMFQQLGTNPRSCATCHGPDMGWTLTAKKARQLFRESDGLDPLFNLVDEGSRPGADISTEEARRVTFDTTLDLAVTRFTRNIPAAGEFTVLAVSDPSGFSTLTQVLNFRRPTPMVNEAKTSSILWNSGPQADIGVSVAGLFGGAATLHLQRDPANPTTPETRAEGGAFAMGLFFAQIKDDRAGRLDAAGAKGGPENVFLQPFTLGANDILSPTFTRKVFDIYDAWAVYDRDNGHGDCRHDRGRGGARAAIYRGQELFNNFEFAISGVPGFNDVMAQETVMGTCSTCHNAPNIGGHAVFRVMDLGTSKPENCDPRLPLLTLQNKTTMETRVTCDMGRGGNGIWADLGKFRVPPLRGLAARAPYFHDGQAKSIAAVVRYYQKRFNMGMSHRQREDLEAFLGAL